MRTIEVYAYTQQEAIEAAVVTSRDEFPFREVSQATFVDATIIREFSAGRPIWRARFNEPGITAEEEARFRAWDR